MLAGEPFASAPEAGLRFIDDQQCSQFLGESLQPFQIPGRGDNHSAGGENGLDDDGGNVSRLGQSHIDGRVKAYGFALRILSLDRAVKTIRGQETKALGNGGAGTMTVAGGENGGEAFDSERKSIIAAIEADYTGLAGAGFRQADSALVCFRPCRQEDGSGEPAWGDLRELSRSLQHYRTEELRAHVYDFLHLLAHSLDIRGVAVAEDRAELTGSEIENHVSVYIDEM